MHRPLNLAAAALVAVSISPTLLVELPAMVDYPNHLARMHILFWSGTPDANPSYQVHWPPYTNRAMDFLVPWLATLTGVELATRLFLLFSQLLVVSGAVALEIAVKGRHQISCFVALLLLYSLPFAWGFLNFEFGVGIALWAISAWISLRDRAWLARVICHILFVCVVMVSHIFAFGLYGFTVGVYELSKVGSTEHWVDVLKNFMLLSIPPVIAATVLLVSGSAAAGGASMWVADTKFQAIYHLLSGYSAGLSAMMILAVCLVVLIYRAAFSVKAPGGLLAASFLVLFMVMPFRLTDGTYADWRVLLGALLILPAFIEVGNQKALVVFVAVLSSAGAMNAANVAGVWLSYRAEYATLKRSFALLPPHTRVLVSHDDEGSDPPANLYDYPIDHAPTLAAHYSKAFVASLATHPSQHSVRPRLELQDLDARATGPANMRELRDVAGGNVSNARPYLRTWLRDFCFLYVVGTLKGNPMPELLREIAAGRQFVLYRILPAMPEKALVSPPKSKSEC